LGRTVSPVLWIRPMIQGRPIRALPISSSPISIHDRQASRRRHGNADAQEWRLNGADWIMQYRIQFLDGNVSVILDLIADARNAAGAIALVADLEWPPHAVTVRMLYVDGREVHSAVKGGGRSEGQKS
jgi:hypothetical protein